MKNRGGELNKYFNFYDDPPDGYCKTCMNDFQKNLYFCSKKCELEAANSIFSDWVKDAPECEKCHIKELDSPSQMFEEYLHNNSIRYVKKLVEHHVVYPIEGSEELTMNVCPKCHSEIHNSDDPELKNFKPPAGDSKKFYKKDTDKTGSMIFCGWCKHEWNARIDHPVRCPKCKSEYITTATSDIECPNCKQVYPSQAKWYDHMKEIRLIKEDLLRKKHLKHKKRAKRLLNENANAIARKLGLR